MHIHYRARHCRRLHKLLWFKLKFNICSNTYNICKNEIEWICMYFYYFISSCFFLLFINLMKIIIITVIIMIIKYSFFIINIFLWVSLYCCACRRFAFFFFLLLHIQLQISITLTHPHTHQHKKITQTMGLAKFYAPTKKNIFCFRNNYIRRGFAII